MRHHGPPHLRGPSRRRDHLRVVAHRSIAGAAPDTTCAHVLISIAREREVQPLPHRRSLNTARLPQNACGLARATLAAPLLSADLARSVNSLSLYSFTDRIEGMSEAEVAVGTRQLARSWFVMRAGGGRGMCDSAVPPLIHGFRIHEFMAHEFMAMNHKVS